ncbi:MAG: O-antigen ligase family protein [Pyrinomonadaceae bacterium]
MSENEKTTLSVWLDRIIFGCVLLTALAAPVSIAVTNIGWITGVFLWLIRSFIRPRPVFFRTKLDFALLGFWGWCLLSCFFSYAPDLSFDRWRVLTLFPIAYLVANNVRETRMVRWLVGALIFSTMVTVGWTFVERGIGRGVQVYGIKPDGALGFAGVREGDTLLKINGKKLIIPEQLVDALQESETPASGTIKINLYRPDYYVDVEIKNSLSRGATMRAEDALGFERWQRGRNWRSAGFYDHYTTYAEVLQLIMSLVLGLLIAHPQKKSKLGGLLLFCLVTMGLALLLTATRASQVGFLLSTLSIVAVGSNRRVFLTILAVFLPLAVIAAIYVQQSRNTGFVDSSDNSTTWRLTVWREGVELLAKSPRHLLVGVGIDSIKRYKCEWGLFDNCTLPAGHFHSTPLQIAVECGLPALFLWLLVVFRYGKSLFVRQKQVTDWFAKGVLLGAFGGLIGFFASGAVHYNLGDSEVAMVFYLIMGLGLVLCRRNLSESAAAQMAD